MTDQKKPQVNSEAGQELFGKFIKDLSELYDTQSIMGFCVVEPKVEEGEKAPQIVLVAQGDGALDAKEVSFQLVKMIGKMMNSFELHDFKNKAEKTLPEKPEKK